MTGCTRSRPDIRSAMIDVSAPLQTRPRPITGMTRYDAVLFDVGGTLLRVTHDPQETAYRRHVQDGDVSLDTFRACLDAAVAEWNAAGGDASCEDLPETWVGHYKRALTAAGFRGDVAATAHRIEASFLADGWELYPDVIPTLETLRASGMPLGVVSNWPATLHETLTWLGLDHYFTVFVGSGVVGYAKPRPEIFRCATSALHVDPARVLYVGDSLSHDLAGARDAGLQSVLLDRTDGHVGVSPRIPHLRALMPLVGCPVPHETSPAPGDAAAEVE